MHLNHEEKMSLLQSLIQLANADGQHRDEEYDMLHLVAEQLEVEPMDMESLFTKNVAFDVPKEETKRIIIFFHMLKMVWADGEFDPDEEKLLRELGARLGLRMQAVDAVIERSRLYHNGNLPIEALIQTFQVHHN